MIEMFATTKNNCRFYHRWLYVKNLNHNEYYLCRDCDARKVVIPDDGYQPVDTDWLYKLIKPNK